MLGLCRFPGPLHSLVIGVSDMVVWTLYSTLFVRGFALLVILLVIAYGCG